MAVLTHRLQVLIDDDRLARLEAAAARTGAPLAELVRRAIDTSYPPGTGGDGSAAAPPRTPGADGGWAALEAAGLLEPGDGEDPAITAAAPTRRDADLAALVAEQRR